MPLWFEMRRGASDDENIPVSYLLYVIAVLVAIMVIAIVGFMFWIH